METRRYGMLPADIYRLTGVTEPHISPDGTRVAYQVWWVDEDENSYRGAIWSTALDGPEVEPRRLTWGERRDAAPRWSPDGKWLAFTSSRNGDKAPQQLYVMAADGGEARRLTDGKEDVSQLAWSPDSTRIAFTRRVPDDPEEDERKRAPRRVRRLYYKFDGEGWLADRRPHIFVASLDGGVRQLTEGDCEDGEPAWSPDGGQIAFSSMRGERWDIELRNRIYLVSADGGEPVALTGTDGSCTGASFSPDGIQIAHYYSPDDGTEPRNTQIAVINTDGSDPRLLTAKLDRECRPVSDSMRLCWDDGRIVFTVEDHGSRHAYAVAADGSAQPQLLVGGELVISGFDARDGRVVYAASTHTAFPELYVAGAPAAGTGGRQLTGVGAAFAADRELAEPERFSTERADATGSGEGGVDAWLVRPAGFAPDGRYPVLLSIHGGPFTQYSTGFFDEFQMYAAAGYAVLFANPRGSSGRSEEWGRAIRGPANGAGPGWGTVDFQDLMSVVDTALRRYPFLDAERMGVLGGSYGGFMTSWVVSHTDRFKAGISERGVSNMVSLFGSSDIFWDFQRDFGGPMWEHADAWRAMSPASYADRIHTPLLIIHSEQDLRCPIEQGEHLFTLLRLMGREVEMLRFPAEGHELSRSGSPRHRVQRFEAILEWFGRYLT
ncbi:MAG TPA: S9 family peptidase [Trebonia sp.]|jgi:dipeptidyl aminopeptidase/acylaminoacyl peptidase